MTGFPLFRTFLILTASEEDLVFLMGQGGM